MSCLAVVHRLLTFRLWYSCTTTFRLGDHVAPRHVGETRAKLGRKCLCRLAEYREVVGDGLLSTSVSFEAILVTLC